MNYIAMQNNYFFPPNNMYGQPQMMGQMHPGMFPMMDTFQQQNPYMMNQMNGMNMNIPFQQNFNNQMNQQYVPQGQEDGQENN